MSRTTLELAKPVVSVIDGHVRGGGMGLVAAADIAIGGPNATYALPEARLGVAPVVISLTVLPRQDSRSASRYFLTGETFDSQEAARIGLLTVGVDDVDEQLSTIVADVVKGSPQGLAESKRLFAAETLRGFDTLPELASRVAKLFGTEEAREGMTAFFQKRPAAWVPAVKA